MEAIKSIDTETAQELAWGESLGEVEYVASQQDSKHRWYTRMLIVFRMEGDLYGFYYDEPATEEQDGQDVFEGDPVPVFPVAAQEVTRTEYLAAR
jgi:hypothetical protein